MVSTRQMSSIGGGSGSGDGAGPSHAETVSVARVTRHSSAQLPGGSSPHASTSKAVLIPAPKIYTTNLLDLPIEVLEKIFRYLGFKNVSHLRMVNTSFILWQSRHLFRYRDTLSFVHRVNCLESGPGPICFLSIHPFIRDIPTGSAFLYTLSTWIILITW